MSRARAVSFAISLAPVWPMKVRLYAVPASHPSLAVALMLKHKAVPYRRRDLPPEISKACLRALGFAGTTVPAVKMGSQRMQGSRRISSELEIRYPKPPLFPSEPERRAMVEEAERFGEEELQEPVRQLLWAAIQRDRGAIRSYIDGAQMAIPTSLAAKVAPLFIALSSGSAKVDEENPRRVLATLPALLDQVDEWIERGILNGGQPNAADFQIAASLGLAMTLDDLSPAIASRPCGALARRIVPDHPGHVPPVFPPAWLKVLYSPSS